MARMLAAAVAHKVGQVCTAAEIQAAFEALHGRTLKTSPSDFAGPNPNSSKADVRQYGYNDQLFDRVGNNYRVRETVIERPASSGKASNYAELLEKAKAEIAALKAAQK